MKNPFKKMPRAKSVMLALILLLFIFAVAIFQFFFSRQAPNGTPGNSPQEAKKEPVDKIKFPSGTSQTEKSVVTPISLIDEAFKGYEFQKVPFTEKKEGQEQKAAHEDKSPATGTPGRQAVKVADEGKAVAKETKPKLSKDSQGSQKEALRSHVRELSVEKSAKNDVSPGRKQAGQNDDVKQLEKLAYEAGLSEAKRKEIIQSYIELCKIIPTNQAQKIIMFRLRNDKSR